MSIFAQAVLTLGIAANTVAIWLLIKGHMYQSHRVTKLAMELYEMEILLIKMRNE